MPYISLMVLYNTDVIHTVGPDCKKQGQRSDLLRSSYSACLELMFKNKLRSIAFPCISTGKYRYPSEAACLGKGTNWIFWPGFCESPLYVYCWLDLDQFDLVWYPYPAACTVALKTIRRYLNEHYEQVDRIIFCLFLSKDIKIYEEKMSEIFKTDLLGTFEVKSVEKLLQRKTFLNWQPLVFNGLIFAMNVLNCNLKYIKKRSTQKGKSK